MACFVPSVISKVLNPNTIIGFLEIGFISMISLGMVIWFIGLDKNMKKMLLNWVKEKRPAVGRFYSLTMIVNIQIHILEIF